VTLRRPPDDVGRRTSAAVPRPPEKRQAGAGRAEHDLGAPCSGSGR
jgi:hypothetical protein